MMFNELTDIIDNTFLIFECKSVWKLYLHKMYDMTFVQDHVCTTCLSVKQIKLKFYRFY